jgi:hypothetical protein
MATTIRLLSTQNKPVSLLDTAATQPQTNKAKSHQRQTWLPNGLSPGHFAAFWKATQNKAPNRVSQPLFLVYL